MTSMEQVISLYRLGERERALELVADLPPSPQRNQAWISLLIRRRRGDDLDRATHLAREWLRMQPGHPEPIRRLVELALFRGRLQQALEEVERLILAAPGHPAALMMKGVVLQRQGQVDLAYQAFLEAEKTQPEHVQSAVPRALMRLYETAGGNYPGSPGRNDLALLDEDELASRLADALRQWQTDTPEDAWTESDRRDLGNAWYNLGCRAMAHFDRLDECIDSFDSAIELAPDHLLARSNRVFALNYDTRMSPIDLLREHQRFGNRLAESVTGAAAWPKRKRPGARLAIGYLSSDFRRHSVAHYIWPVLVHHDADAFDIHLFHTDSRQDDMTRRMRETGAQYHAVAGVDDPSLQRRIREAGIDILVELNGLTEGHRLSLLARRAAPLQVSWIGYPNITGLPTIDYRIVDDITDPPGEEAGVFAEAGPERLWRLPGPFSVYSYAGDLPEVASPPCIRAGHVTFGSFNNMAKLNLPLVALWATLLKAVPNARLLIKNIALTCRSPRERLQAAFEAQGIAVSRLEFHGRVNDQSEHMAFFNRVDICLDSFPYNGTTTNCDSLLMGVPFVTLEGKDHRSRVGASQLTHLGLESWVADNEQDYVRIAAGLAADHDALRDWRERLRQRLMDSPLMDAAGFTARLESAYRDMWAAE